MRSRSLVLALAGVLLFAVALVALLIGGNKLNTPVAAAGDRSGSEESADNGPAGGEIVIAVEKTVNGDTTSGTVRLRFSDPDFLPADGPQATGLFLHRDGDQLALGAPPIEVAVDVEAINDAAPITVVNARHEGGEIAVQLGPDTRFYRDTTARPEITADIIAAGEVIIERTLEPGSAGDLGENMVIRVWGEMRDGGLQAQIVVYKPIR